MTRCHADRVTGALRVTGSPGGLFHLRDGAVLAVDSPGAPGPETLLVRSGRITEADWIAALREGVPDRSQHAALVAGGAIESGELHDVLRAAIQDGTLATVAGDIEECLVDEESTDVLLPLPDGLTPDELLADTQRRLDELAALPVALSPHRERVARVRGQRPSAPAQQEILAQVNGRRTARDIAFALGRGVHPVTVELSRMLGENLLEIAPSTTPIGFTHWGFASLRRRAERNHIGL